MFILAIIKRYFIYSYKYSTQQGNDITLLLYITYSHVFTTISLYDKHFNINY